MKTKKYITTDKHPQLKEGIALTFSDNRIVYEGFYLEIRLDSALEKGYIKEVQEPEFTRDELKDIIYSMYGGSKKKVFKDVDSHFKFMDEYQDLNK